MGTKHTVGTVQLQQLHNTERLIYHLDESWSNQEKVILVPTQNASENIFTDFIRKFIKLSTSDMQCMNYKNDANQDKTKELVYYIII